MSQRSNELFRYHTDNNQTPILQVLKIKNEFGVIRASLAPILPCLLLILFSSTSFFWRFFRQTTEQTRVYIITDNQISIGVSWFFFNFFLSVGHTEQIVVNSFHEVVRSVLVEVIIQD